MAGPLVGSWKIVEMVGFSFGGLVLISIVAVPVVAFSAL
jgi:hypothetical protein